MNKISSIIRACIIVTLFLGATTAFAASEDQVNYWTFDEGAGRSVTDTVGGQNGVLTGSSTGFGWAGGKVGTALGMDGGVGESVVLPDGALNGSQGSIAFWFKLNNLSERNILFSGKSTSDNNIYVAIMVDREGRPQVQFRDSSTGNDRKAQGAKILNTNEWYDLVLTANGQTYRMYVNNEEVAVAGDNLGRWFPDFTNQTLTYRIGSLDSSPLGGVLDGYVDDVRVYNRVLNAGDIGELYEKGNASGPTVPLAIRPTLSFSTSNDHVPFGGSALLEWSSKNVTSCVGSGGWNGPINLAGTRTFVKLGSNVAYSITCDGKGGKVSETINIIVGEQGAAESQTLQSKVAVTETVISLPTNIPVVASTREETIKKLIAEIMVLIGELQKQLEILKATTH